MKDVPIVLVVEDEELLQEIVHDALKDGGCDNADILQHCRSEGPHCRGCWPIDLLLSKERMP